MSPYSTKGGTPVPPPRGTGRIGKPFDDKPTVVGPVEEYTEPGIQRMSEYGGEPVQHTYTAPLGEQECDHCLAKFPLDYFHGTTCRHCFMMGY